MRPVEHIAFDGRTQFHAAVIRALESCRHGILVLDRSLEDWPLETADGARALRGALTRGATLRVLLSRTDWVERHGARLQQLRREFSARIEFRRIPASLQVDDSVLVGDRQHTLRRAHWETTRGVCVLASPSEAESPANRYESLWQESEPCLPATTLGL